MTAILDYRNAKFAIELLNSGTEQAKQMEKFPQLARLLQEITKAQQSE